MTEFVVRMDNRPGRLAALIEALAESGVNIEALAAFGINGDGMIRLIVDDAAAARRTFQEAGLAAEEHAAAVERRRADVSAGGEVGVDLLLAAEPGRRRRSGRLQSRAAGRIGPSDTRSAPPIPRRRAPARERRPIGSNEPASWKKYNRPLVHRGKKQVPCPPLRSFEPALSLYFPTVLRFPVQKSGRGPVFRIQAVGGRTAGNQG